MEAANRYEILSKLAVGGMAEIFLARSASVAGVQRYVVLKRILSDYANNTQFVHMFLDEARLAAQLQHPNIAQVFDVGKLGDSYFFTMEHVHGETVRSILEHSLQRNRELGLSFAMGTVAGCAAGLHHAHERLGMDGRPLGIVHRDVSPANIMVSFEGIVKVVDFGVAKAENRVQTTQAGTVKGKINYLSPEQCRGTPLNRRSDLFSLGIVMWELLTRNRLYRRSSDWDTMTAIVTEPTPPPSAYAKMVPAEIDRLVLRLLAKEPADRYPSGEELGEELEYIATKLAVALNVSSMRTVLREMFGKRPEPWQAIDNNKRITLAMAVPADPMDLESYALIEVGSPTADVNEMLRTLDVAPMIPPADLDFDMATTRDAPSVMSAAMSAAMTARGMPARAPETLDEDDGRFGDDEHATIRDEGFHFDIPNRAKTRPMGSVTPDNRQPAPPTAAAPPTVFVSESLAPPDFARPKQSAPRVAPVAPRAQRDVQTVPVPTLPAPKTGGSRWPVILALVVILAAGVVIVVALRGN